MKKLLSIAVILLMFVLGCSNQENSITSPISNNEQLSKITLNSTSIPEPLPVQYVTTAKVINGSIGGVISFEKDALDSQGRVVHVYSQFQVSPGAFTGTQNITMTADVNTGCITFSPHMNFSQTCFLDYGFSNVNLLSLGFLATDKKADFVYFGDAGSIEQITNLGVTLNVLKGIARVSAARINHFSRYGFIRKAA